jgi:hypothetical protein
MWVTYASLIGGHEGIFAQKLTATGHASGAGILLPGSATGGQVAVPDQRVGTTGRGAHRPGVYAAYTDLYGDKVLVGRLGSRTATVVAKGSVSSFVVAVTVTASPDGRLWVAWVNEPSPFSYQLFVIRSNASVTAFSKPKAVPLPPGTPGVWKVYMNARSANADIVALLSSPKTGSIAYWSRVISPPA